MCNRVLVLQLRKLGDTLMSTPLIRQLAWLYAPVRIDVVCQGANACILENNPHVAKIETLPSGWKPAVLLRLAARLRRARYDMVVDAQGLTKTALLAWLSRAPRRIGFHKRWRRRLYTQTLGLARIEYAAVHKLLMLGDDRVDLEDLTLDFPVGAQVKQRARAFADRWFRRPVAAVYGVSRMEPRNWPVEKLAEIGDRLAGCGFQPFIVHGPGEYAAARAIRVRMRCDALVDYPPPSFAVLKELIGQCELMVTVNGGPMHLATAAETPNVRLFENDWMAMVWSPPRRPDMRVVATRRITEGPAVEGTFTDAQTLEDIEVDAVWSEVEKLIELGFVSKPRRAA